MSQYAAFLRGVNLGRHRKVSGLQLREMYEGMGFSDVGTFRTSGNVVFGGAKGSVSKLTARIEKGMAEALGWEVKVFLRTADEVRAIAAHQPFDRQSEGKLHVSLLDGKPSASARKEVLALATEADLLAFGDRELYWLTRGRMVESELDLELIEKLIGPITRRTKGTIELLAEKFFQR